MSNEGPELNQIEEPEIMAEENIHPQDKPSNEPAISTIEQRAYTLLRGLAEECLSGTDISSESIRSLHIENLSLVVEPESCCVIGRGIPDELGNIEAYTVSMGSDPELSYIGITKNMPTARYSSIRRYYDTTKQIDLANDNTRKLVNVLRSIKGIDPAGKSKAANRINVSALYLFAMSEFFEYLELMLPTENKP